MNRFLRSNLQGFARKLRKTQNSNSPSMIDSPSIVTWLKPKLVYELFLQVLANNRKLPMPRFRRLRKSKPYSENTLDQASPSGLEEYRKKRDFNVTAEPTGEVKISPTRVFVVQEHHARRLHYDLRLENAGVLKSWAVPKGIPMSNDQKRLAVQTEDHPIDYAGFEGNIPEGQYGAGSVKIWDKGTFEVKTWNNEMIEITLKGEKLGGKYVLVRLKKTGDKNWLLLKARN